MLENAPKRIDVHAHALLSKEIRIPRLDNTALHDYHELCDFYDCNGITMGIILPIVSPEFQSFLITNEDAWFMSDRSANRLRWCCNIDPRMELFSHKTDFSRMLRFYKSKGAVGVGEVMTNVALDDPIMDNLLFHCAECDMPVTIHWTSDLSKEYGVYGGADMSLLEKTLKKYPRLKIVGHSVPFWDLLYEKEGIRRLVCLMRECPNLYCDTSAKSGYNAASNNASYFYEFLNEFQDRILFGLDVCNLGDLLHKKIIKFYDDAFKNKFISETVYNKINYINAVKLYNL